MKDSDGPPTTLGDNTMLPPSAYPQPQVSAQGDQSKTQTKRRQSRFDPMGNDPEEEGYGDSGHRHTFRKLNEEEHRPSFTLPGIRSLLNPSAESKERDSSTASTPYQQSPSLPSLVSTSPSGSPSTSRTSRYSSLASGSSISAESHGWWAPGYDRTPSESSNPRSGFPSVMSLDDHDNKRRRSDQPQSARDQDEQARLKWMAQSRNASYPTSAVGDANSASSSPVMRTMQPPAPPSASMSRHSKSQQDSRAGQDARPVPVERSLSLVSGPLANSFADLSATERERQNSMPHLQGMPPPFPSPLTMDRDRRFSFQQQRERERVPHHSHSHNEVHQLRSNTATPPARFRAYSHPPEQVDTGRNDPQRAPRSSLSDLIKAQSGDARSIGRGGYPSEPTYSDHPHSGWRPARRASNSSTQSGMAINLNSDDGHAYSPKYRRDQRGDLDRDGNPMAGMDVLAESARRVSEEEEYRRGSMGADEFEDGPKAGGPGGPKYQCAYCSKTFSRPSSLRIHTYSHTGERPFICKEPSCGRRFSVQSNLKRHAKVHQLGQAGGASLHQLHGGPVPPRGPGPGPGPGQGFYGQPPHGYGYDNRYPTQPYPQPRGPPMDPRYHNKEWNHVDDEEDELQDEEEMEDERVRPAHVRA